MNRLFQSASVPTFACSNSGLTAGAVAASPAGELGSPTEAPLLRWLQLALEPAYHSVGFQRVGPLAIEALECARTRATGR